MKQLITWIVIMAAFAGACTSDKGEIPQPAAPSCDTTITYTSSIKAIVSSNCTNTCHQAGSAEGDLTNYEGLKLKAQSGRLRQMVIVEKKMPPSGPLPAEEIRKIECWLDAGFPE